MSDTENTTTPKPKKPTLSVTYVKLLSFLFNSLDGEEIDFKHRIMEKMCTFAPVEEQIEFFSDLCSNENWKDLMKDYKAYVREDARAVKANAKKAEKEDAKAAKAAEKAAEKAVAKEAEMDDHSDEEKQNSSDVDDEKIAPSTEDKPKKKNAKKK